MDFHAEQVYIFFTYNTIPPLFYWFCCFWTIVQTYIPPSPALGQFSPIWPHAWGSPRFGWQAELCHQKVLPSTASNWPKNALTRSIWQYHNHIMATYFYVLCFTAGYIWARPATHPCKETNCWRGSHEGGPAQPPKPCKNGLSWLPSCIRILSSSFLFPILNAVIYSGQSQTTDITFY